jgi:hypothetical protein
VQLIIISFVYELVSEYEEDYLEFKEHLEKNNSSNVPNIAMYSLDHVEKVIEFMRHVYK